MAVQIPQIFLSFLADFWVFPSIKNRILNFRKFLKIFILHVHRRLAVLRVAAARSLLAPAQGGDLSLPFHTNTRRRRHCSSSTRCERARKGQRPGRVAHVLAVETKEKKIISNFIFLNKCTKKIANTWEVKIKWKFKKRIFEPKKIIKNAKNRKKK